MLVADLFVMLELNKIKNSVVSELQPFQLAVKEEFDRLNSKIDRLIARMDVHNDVQMLKMRVGTVEEKVAQLEKSL
ncbi:MAG: hypothetical protein V1902_02810 [Candidatus Falkowbacteria bacterium]